MAKKTYYVAPAITETEILPTVILAGSPSATVDGTEDKINYDPTPGDASGGLARRRHDVWEDEEEEI